MKKDVYDKIICQQIYFALGFQRCFLNTLNIPRYFNKLNYSLESLFDQNFNFFEQEIYLF